jgi:hypothetical protein
VFTEDLSQFFDETTGFAISVTFMRGAAEIATVRAIFNDPSHSVEVQSTDIEEAAPFLQAPTASLAPVKRGDKATVNGAHFRVERLHPDGTGTSIVWLAEA